MCARPHEEDPWTFSKIELFRSTGIPMTFDRRAFIAGSVGAVLAGTGVTTTATGARARRSIKAVLFDAFPLFDSRPVLAAAERVYPEKGAILTQAWRTRQFEYQCGCARLPIATSISGDR